MFDAASRGNRAHVGGFTPCRNLKHHAVSHSEAGGRRRCQPDPQSCQGGCLPGELSACQHGCTGADVKLVLILTFDLLYRTYSAHFMISAKRRAAPFWLHAEGLRLDLLLLQTAGITEILQAPGKLVDRIPGISGTRNLGDNLSDLKAQVRAVTLHYAPLAGEYTQHSAQQTTPVIEDTISERILCMDTLPSRYESW